MPEDVQNLLDDLQNLPVLEIFLMMKYFINCFYFIWSLAIATWILTVLQQGRFLLLKLYFLELR